jgi:hypothetical protein
VNKLLKLSFVTICLLFVAASSFGDNQPIEPQKFNFDHLLLDRHVVTLNAKSNPIEPPYTVNPSTGKFFASAPGRKSYYGYRADNDIGWWYYLTPPTNDSVFVDFDFNVHYALDDTFNVLALLEPDSNGVFWYGVEYMLEYPDNNTGNTWVTLTEVLDGGLVFVPSPDSIAKYGPVTFVVFEFASNSIRNGIDGFGFGVAIDNVKFDIFSNGSKISFKDNFEDSLAYRNPVHPGLGFALDYNQVGDSPDRWAWLNNYLYTPIAALSSSTWQDIKQGK